MFVSDQSPQPCAHPTASASLFSLALRRKARPPTTRVVDSAQTAHYSQAHADAAPVRSSFGTPPTEPHAAPEAQPGSPRQDGRGLSSHREERGSPASLRIPSHARTLLTPSPLPNVAPAAAAAGRAASIPRAVRCVPVAAVFRKPIPFRPQGDSAAGPVRISVPAPGAMEGGRGPGERSGTR